MASVGQIQLIRCPGCGERVIPPPPESYRAWQCPFCRRRFHRRLKSSESSGTIPCIGLFNKNPWPPDECRTERERSMLHPARWASLLLSGYAGVLIVLILAYHLVMTVLATVWFVIRAPVLIISSLADDEEPEDDPARTSSWLEPVRTWLPHFQHRDPDLGIGPRLTREDAPGVFVIVAEVARKVGSREPDEIRVTHLPCCGVVEQRRCGGLLPGRRVLVVGLPLLYVFSIEELRGVVAHELAHLSRGDAALAFVVSQFLDSLEQWIETPASASARWLNPCVLFARWVRGMFRLLSGPLSRHQEYRADRLGALVCGSDVLASALRNVALVQPVFREVLCHYHPTVVRDANLYQFFRAAWLTLSDDLKSEMQDALASEERAELFSPHPTLRARLTRLDRYPPHVEPDNRSARRLLAERHQLEETLHNYLYRPRNPRLSVFQPACQ